MHAWDTVPNRQLEYVETGKGTGMEMGMRMEIGVSRTNSNVVGATSATH